MTPLSRWAAAYAVAGLDGYERAVLVALAYHASSDALTAWPSIERLAEETAFSEDTCRRAIRRLCERGVVDAVLSSGRKTNKYRLVALQPSLSATVDPSPLATVDDANGDTNPRQQQLQPSLVASQPSPPATRTKKNRERTGKGARKRATPAPKTFLITDEMRKWAVGKGVPAGDVDTETEAFLDYHRSKGNTLKDWKAAWRNWIRKVVEFRRADSRGREKAGKPRPIRYASEDVS